MTSAHTPLTAYIDFKSISAAVTNRLRGRPPWQRGDDCDAAQPRNALHGIPDCNDLFRFSRDPTATTPCLHPPNGLPLRRLIVRSRNLSAPLELRGRRPTGRVTANWIAVSFHPAEHVGFIASLAWNFSRLVFCEPCLTTCLLGI